MEQEEIKLDFELKTPQRLELVQKIIETSSPEKLNNKYLEILADYILYSTNSTVGERKEERSIITPNKMTHIRERETSLDGMVVKFETSESGNAGETRLEDSIYNLAINDKNVLLSPKLPKFTEEDIENIPGLKELREEINRLEEAFEKAKGKAKYSIKNNIIDLRKDQYVLRASYKKPIYCTNLTKSIKKLDIYEEVEIVDKEVIVKDSNISLLIPQHISFLLCNYSKIKEDCYSCFESDILYLMMALEDLVEKALEDYPMYKDVLIYKIDGLQNLDIQRELERKYGSRYSIEYISSLWRKKIPKLIADQAKKDYVLWYYTEKEKGYWKRCSKCGQYKLGHPFFFSKNKSSKDGWYSICKKCRNKKKG